MKNWAGNYRFGASQVHRPTSIEELGRVIASADKVRAVGSRHSFTDIADADEMVDLSALPETLEFDRQAGTVSVNAGVTYTRLCELIAPHGVALHNLASLPHISIAGAIATATHGSGTPNGNLATAVSALDLMTSDGEVVSLRRGDAEFDGIVVSLGALGVVTRVTLDVQPAFDVAQAVYEELPWAALSSSFETLFAAGYSVSAFTRYAGPAAETVWVKQRTEAAADTSAGEFFGARPARVAHHPIPGHPADGCTEQFGVVGPWHERLPHFTAGAIPSAGDEIQSEFFVPLDNGAAAVEALRGAQTKIDDALMVGEIRTVAQDSLWMSPQYQRATAAFHFTWKPDQAAAERAAAVVAAALAPLSPRPHWGKVFPWEMLSASTYPRHREFIALTERLDPRGAFRNDWFTQLAAAS